MDDNKTLGFATLVHSSSNGLFGGTVTTKEKSYELITMPDGSIEVRSLFWKDMPKGKMPKAIRLSKDSYKANNVGKIAKKSLVDMASVSEKPIQTKTYSEGKAAKLLHGTTRRRRQLQSSNTVVDLIFFVTNRAMCEAAGLEAGCEDTQDNWNAMLSYIDSVMSTTNNAMQLVGAPVEIRLVRTYFFPRDFGDVYATGDHLSWLSNNADIERIRTEDGADLVSVIGTESSEACGLAYLFAPYSINGYDPYCNSIHTITHEL
jgi:hypothetical protein